MTSWRPSDFFHDSSQMVLDSQVRDRRTSRTLDSVDVVPRA